MEKWLSFVLSVLFAVLFTAIVFYAAHTVFSSEENLCWEKYPYPVYASDKNFDSPEVIAEQQEADKKQQECNNLWNVIEKSTNGKKLILIGIINVIVLGILFFIGISTIGLGLLFGTIISSIIATIAFYDSASIVALIIIVILFLEIVFFIQKNWNKN